MNFTETLIRSIDERIAAAHAEIDSLEKAVAALDAPSSNRTVARANGGMSASNGHARTANGASRPARAARRRAAPRQPASIDGKLAQTLEQLLRKSGDGLSATALSKQADAGYAQVLELLRGLERAGDVRRSGTRRTSLWRLVTDEERIAERAAELERLAAG